LKMTAEGGHTKVQDFLMTLGQDLRSTVAMRFSWLSS
jgi:hypothetical protein